MGATDSEDMKLAGGLTLDPLSLGQCFLTTHLPHKAVYITFTMISVCSLIFGIGRSSMAMTWGSLKTTAFIVSFVIAFPFLTFFLGILGMRRCKDAGAESEGACHNVWHVTAVMIAFAG